MNYQAVKGFLAEDEGRLLSEYAKASAHLGPILEIGSYCGRSTLYLAHGCQLAQGCHSAHHVVYAVDHHRGSEEHQPGQEYHDASLVNRESGCFDTFNAFQENMRQYGVGDTVIPIVCRSELLGKVWQQELGMVFVDGGHSAEQASIDCQLWAAKVAPGGVLAMHDIYMTTAEGGQSPRRALAQIMETGFFTWERKLRSLVLVRRRKQSKNNPENNIENNNCTAKTG